MPHPVRQGARASKRASIATRTKRSHSGARCPAIEEGAQHGRSRPRRNQRAQSTKMAGNAWRSAAWQRQ
eukprot:4480651-Pyramimonas_sp.AAC.1